MQFHQFDDHTETNFRQIFGDQMDEATKDIIKSSAFNTLKNATTRMHVNAGDLAALEKQFTLIYNIGVDAGKLELARK